MLDGKPVGYFGVIKNDIRICVHPDHQKKGVGKFLVNSCYKIWPNAFAKIKVNNESSKKLFESCGFSWMTVSVIPLAVESMSAMVRLIMKYDVELRKRFNGSLYITRRRRQFPRLATK